MTDETMFKLLRACVWIVGITTTFNVALFIYKLMTGE